MNGVGRRLRSRVWALVMLGSLCACGTPLPESKYWFASNLKSSVDEEFKAYLVSHPPADTKRGIDPTRPFIPFRHQKFELRASGPDEAIPYLRKVALYYGADQFDVADAVSYTRAKLKKEHTTRTETDWAGNQWSVRTTTTRVVKFDVVKVNVIFARSFESIEKCDYFGFRPWTEFEPLWRRALEAREIYDEAAGPGKRGPRGDLLLSEFWDEAVMLRDWMRLERTAKSRKWEAREISEVMGMALEGEYSAYFRDLQRGASRLAWSGNLTLEHLNGYIAVLKRISSEEQHREFLREINMERSEAATEEGLLMPGMTEALVLEFVGEPLRRAGDAWEYRCCKFGFTDEKGSFAKVTLAEFGGNPRRVVNVRTDKRYFTDISQARAFAKGEERP